MEKLKAAVREKLDEETITDAEIKKLHDGGLRTIKGLAQAESETLQRILKPAVGLADIIRKTFPDPGAGPPGTGAGSAGLQHTSWLADFVKHLPYSRVEKRSMTWQGQQVQYEFLCLAKPLVMAPGLSLTKLFLHPTYKELVQGIFKAGDYIPALQTADTEGAAASHSTLAQDTQASGSHQPQTPSAPITEAATPPILPNLSAPCPSLSNPQSPVSTPLSPTSTHHCHAPVSLDLTQPAVGIHVRIAASASSPGREAVTDAAGMQAPSPPAGKACASPQQRAANTGGPPLHGPKLPTRAPHTGGMASSPPQLAKRRAGDALDSSSPASRPRLQPSSSGAAGTSDTQTGQGQCKGPSSAGPSSLGSDPQVATDRKRHSSGGGSTAHATKSVMTLLSTPSLSILLLGTAGVGKTVFLFILMRELLIRGLTIFWHSKASPNVLTRISERGLKVEDFQREHVVRTGMLQNELDWYVADSTEPMVMGVKARSFLTTSPKAASEMNEFSKHALKAYARVWTLHELLCAAELMDTSINLTPEKVEELWGLAGGCPREVLERHDINQLPALKEAIRSAIRGMRIEDIKLALQVDFPVQRIPNLVFHVWANKLERTTMAFASDYAAKQTLAELAVKGADALFEFAQACKDEPLLSSAWWYILEKLMDKILQAGNVQMDLIHLDSQVSSTIQLPPLQLFIFNELKEVLEKVDSKQGWVCVPAKRKNWPVADHYIVLAKPLDLHKFPVEVQNALKNTRVIFVQSTVGKRHGIMEHHYKKQSELLNSQFFAFATSDDSRLNTVQALLNMNKTVKQTKTAPIQQFALRVHMSEQRTRDVVCELGMERDDDEEETVDTEEDGSGGDI